MTSEGGGTLGGGGAPPPDPPDQVESQPTGADAALGHRSPEGTTPALRPPLERLQFDPYDAPKSHHASRAFAEMQARARRGRRKKKITLLVVALVVGGAVLWAVTSGLLHLLNS